MGIPEWFPMLRPQEGVLIIDDLEAKLRAKDSALLAKDAEIKDLKRERDFLYIHMKYEAVKLLRSKQATAWNIMLALAVTALSGRPWKWLELAVGYVLVILILKYGRHDARAVNPGPTSGN